MFRFFGSAVTLFIALIVASFLTKADGTPAATPSGAGAGPGAPAAAEPAPPPVAPGQVQFQIDEATLTRQANASVAGMPISDTPLGSATVRDLNVRLRGGQLVATGTAQVGPTPLPVQLGGTVQVQNSRPRIVLSDARISGVQVPQAARQSVEASLQSQLDGLLAAQPMRVSSVTIGNGLLTIIGQRA